MAGTVLIWIAAGALGGAVAGVFPRLEGYVILGSALLGMLAGLLGGAIVALFDGSATLHAMLGSVGMAFLAGLLQILTLRLLNDSRQPARR